MEFIFDKKAEKHLGKLDNTIQKRIKNFVLELETLQNPRDRGKALVSNLNGLWRYRIGDYRLICHIDNDKLVILCLEIAHRSKAY